MKFLSLILGLVGCGYFDGERTQTATPSENPRVQDLRDTAALKRAELDMLLDADGYPIGRNDCDLTLWAGEARYAGVEVNLDLVELAPGVVHRRPTPCWTPEQGDVGSKSTTSSDMLAGYLLGRWAEENLPALQRLANHGEKNRVIVPVPGWVMGQPYPEMASRVVLRPTAIGVLGRLLYALSLGSDDRSYRKWQPLYGPGEDSERHVQAVGILTDSTVSEFLRMAELDAEADQPQPAPTELATTDLTMLELDALNYYAETEPQNYFYQAILFRYSGDPAPALDLLLDDATPVPTYVRGAHQRAYELIHWLCAATVVLERYHGGD